MKSFKPVVKVVNESKFHDNGQRFATHGEALSAAKDIRGRWMLVTDIDVQESDDEINYQIIDNTISMI